MTKIFFQNMIDVNSGTLIFKVTNSCNLNCNYCYYSKQEEFTFLNISKAQEALLIFAQKWSVINVVFHGGEPLLAKEDFFEKIITYQKYLTKKYSTVFTNCIQTNGTIYTKYLSDFFFDNGFSLGISLDGIKLTHDLNRSFKSGLGSFELVFSNLIKYKNDGHIITVLLCATKIVTQHSKEIFLFFKENNIDFQVSEIVGGTQMQNDITPTQKELASFFCEIFKLWLEQKEKIIQIIPIEDIVYAFINNTNINLCVYNGCENFYALDVDGSLYLCDNYKTTNFFHIGKNFLSKDDIKSLTEKINLRKKNLVDCINCKWIKICNGGCLASSIIDNKNFLKKTYWCEARKIYFEYICSELNKL